MVSVHWKSISLFWRPEQFVSLQEQPEVPHFFQRPSAAYPIVIYFLLAEKESDSERDKEKNLLLLLSSERQRELSRKVGITELE